MSRFQVVVVLLCLAMNIVEGFDILVMAFAASGVAAEWHLSGSQIGLLLSSGLIGMAVGSALVAPLADRVGRRPLIVACLGIATLGMVLAAVSPGFVALALCRLVTGIGVGGVMAGLPVLITEYSNRRSRGTAVAVFALGLPLGGVLGGVVAALVTAEFGWRATFGLGAALSLVIALLMLRVLPESLDFLVTRRPAGALARINALLARMRLEPLAELPPPVAADVRGVGPAVLRGRNGARSALLWISFFSLFAALYFATSWTPRLLEQSGLSAQQGISGGILLNLGGVVGTLLISVLALRFTSRVLGAATLALAAAAFLTMTVAFGDLTATLVTAIAVGIMLNANGAALYALAPSLYPASVRTTAVGWAIAAGRLGGILSPIVAGVLLDRGWTAPGLFGLFAIPLAVAALAVVVIGRIRPAPARTPAEQPAPA